MDEAADKQRLRAAARKIRAAAHEADAAGDAPDQVADRFLAAFTAEVGRGSRAIVAGYWPFGTELDVRPLLHRLAALGVGLALPVTRDADLPLEFRRWKPGDGLVQGAYGISHPQSLAPVVRPSLLLLPLLAFDAQGWRLGYGAGYYDRTLAALRGLGVTRAGGLPVLAVGIAYAAQETAMVPHHSGDQRLDGIVTEKAARRFT
jgi:5-formyltetrahydrofolate cyclo-ligase